MFVRNSNDYSLDSYSQMFYFSMIHKGIDKSGDSPMQADNNEAVDELPDLKAAIIENIAANCDDGSSTNVKRDETIEAANELSNDKNVNNESSGEDEPKTGDLVQKSVDNECDVAEPLEVNDFDKVKAASDEIDSSIVNDIELKRVDELCNGNIEKQEIPKDDKNIATPTLNGETLAENPDTADSDINFDQIFDNLPENSTTANSTDAQPIENDVQPIETVPEIPEVAVSNSKADESETNQIEQMDEIKEIEETEKDEKIEETKENDEMEKTKETNESPESSGINKNDAKVNNVSLEISPEAEEELLNSPSMNEQSGNISTEYSESMLLKDDSKIGTAAIDEVDTEKITIETMLEAKSLAEPDNSLPSDSLFDQLKATEAVQELAQKATNRPEESDIVIDQESSTDKNKDELGLEINTDSDGLNSKESTEAPTTSSVQSANNIDESIGESMDTTENKENNLLEEMVGSPNSIGHCMEGGSMSSARDGDDNEFANSVIDLKDGNSNDARDGFDNDNLSSDHEMMDQTSNSGEKNDTKYLSNVNRSIEEESSADYTSEVILDLQDSIESGCKSFTGNDDDDDDVVDTPDKSNESVIAIDDDDADSSAAALAAKEPNDKADDEIKDIEDIEPPAKRMRIESDEANDMPSTDSTQENDGDHTEKAVVLSEIEKSNTKYENVSTVEPHENVSIEKDADKSPTKIEDDDDDDIVIVESNETKQTAVADADAIASNVTTSNKRPASSLQIDETDDTRKKHKLSEDDIVNTDTAATVAIVTDVTATINKLDERKDTIKTEAVKVESEVEKKSSEENKEEKLSCVDAILKSPKIEDGVNEQMKETKPVKIELKTDLKPKPEECEKRSIALDFAAKFKKGLAQMSRKNLEEFVLVKITEAIVHKSEFSELKQKSDAQEQMIQASRVKLQEIGKQYRDLEMVYARLKKDLENKNQNIVSPIKITRAVGLQVSIQKDGTKAASQKQPVVTSNGVVTYSSNVPAVRTIVRSDQATAPTGSLQHPRLASSLASKQITHIQRQPVRQAAIRPAIPEQPRIAATTGMMMVCHCYCCCSMRIKATIAFLYRTRFIYL